MDAYSFGQYLRDSRESKEIELADVVAALRIRQPILEAFEAGEFAATNMSAIQLRGLLRIYARFLGLDEEDVLRLYDEMRRGIRPRGRWTFRKRAPKDSGTARRQDSAPPMQEIVLEQRRASRRGRWWRILILLLVSATAIAVIAFVTLELIDAPAMDEAGDDLPAQAPSTEIAPTPIIRPTPTFTPTIAPTDSVNRAQYGRSGILASILTRQRTWIRINSDGLEQYAGIAAPGNLLEYRAISEISVTASNAMALDIVWNGEQQGRFGGRGQWVDIRFSADEVTFSTGPRSAPTLVSPTALPSATAILTATPLAASSTTGPSPTASLSPVPTEPLTFSPAPTLTPSSTAPPSDSPTLTDTPTITMTPVPTAILPPRVTQEGLIPTKVGA